MRNLSPVKQKILLLLLAGAALGLARTPGRQWKIVRGARREWKRIDKRKLYFDIRALYRSKLVHTKEHGDGSISFTITDKGKLRILKYHFAEMKLQKTRWDASWRFVIFDIPNKLKYAREALRMKLKILGFYQLQESTFVFPYECRNEIEFIVEFFGLRKFVRFGLMSNIDNDIHLREIFHI